MIGSTFIVGTHCEWGPDPGSKAVSHSKGAQKDKVATTSLYEIETSSKIFRRQMCRREDMVSKRAWNPFRSGNRNAGHFIILFKYVFIRNHFIRIRHEDGRNV